MLFDVGFIIAGLAMLFFGGEWLVKGSVGVAVRFGVSTLLVSLVIIGFGTSAPELVVSVQAALNGSPEISLGNVVGSNIANILLILGVAAVIYPVASGSLEIRRNALIVIAASLFLCALTFLHAINLIAGVVMIAILAGYIFWSYSADKKSRGDEAVKNTEAHVHTQEDAPEAPRQLWVCVAFIVAGLVLLVVGANLLVKGAVSIATAAGVSEAIIGLTLVAVGTSLPELATAVVAALKKHGDVVIGNVLGSNMFNILFILGVTGIISPLPMEGRIADIDVWVMLGIAVLLYPLVRTSRKIDRKEGIFMLALYAAYTAAMFII